MPKLEPTIPVHVQFLSAPFDHLAVAVVPTFRHLIDADAGETARTARAVVERMIMFAVEFDSSDDLYKESSSHCLKYSFHT